MPPSDRTLGAQALDLVVKHGELIERVDQRQQADSARLDAVVSDVARLKGIEEQRAKTEANDPGLARIGETLSNKVPPAYVGPILLCIALALLVAVVGLVGVYAPDSLTSVPSILKGGAPNADPGAAHAAEPAAE
jgi:hypothetical protein